MLSGLVLFALAAASLVLATYRVAVRGRVLVLPFGGNDARRVELTDLLVRRMTRMEHDWVTLTERIVATRDHVNDLAVVDAEMQESGSPLFEGRAVRVALASEAPGVSGAAPRTSGDEVIKEVFELGGVGAIGNADLGVISLAGVSFSRRDVLALLRAAPGVFARRVLRGAILNVAHGALVSVEYQERGFLRHNRINANVEVTDDQWVPAIEQLAFDVERERVDHLLDKRQRRRWRAGPQESMTVRRGVVEARSWSSCESFLRGYVSHLEHYRYGRATDRDEALAYYEAALDAQQGYPRAAYNRATLLYNRYLPLDNEKAIVGFTEATGTDEVALRALAFAGVAMARCQAIQRFDRSREEHRDLASDAATAAKELRPDLEEALFADAWICQVDGEWDEAIGRYRAVGDLPGRGAPERRIQSFALNNAAWIMLNKLDGTTERRGEAERLLWRAQALYPNKAAYTNLGQIARKLERWRTHSHSTTPRSCSTVTMRTPSTSEQ